MHKTFAQFILHTFWCIMMHIDAFWALRKKYWPFSIKKLKFFKLKFHAKNIRIIHSAYILMHFDALCYILMHFDAFWCTLVYLNVIKTTSLIIEHTKNSFWCILMHSEHIEKNRSFSTKKRNFLHLVLSAQNVSIFIKMH